MNLVQTTIISILLVHKQTMKRHNWAHHPTILDAINDKENAQNWVRDGLSSDKHDFSNL
jgi:hypothetical protein